MESIVNLKNIYDDDFQVEFEVLPIVNTNELTADRRQQIAEKLQDVEGQIQVVQEKIDALNVEIDKLTNHADGLDYSIAVISGVLTGMIDSFFVGETVIDKEKIQKELEKKYHTANDSAYMHKTKDGHAVDSAYYHRFDDLAHHPTPAGLIAAILAEFFRLVIFVDGTDGKPHIFFADKTSNKQVLDSEMKDMQMAWAMAIFSGICMWLSYMVEKEYYKNSNEKIPEPLKKLMKAIAAAPLTLEILKVADKWVGHMMSDVSTSQGIAGIFLSLLKEISVLPGLRNTKLPDIVNGLYSKGEHNLSEWGGVVFVATKKQAMPVLINEALVRGFYFVRHLAEEIKLHESLKEVNWNNTIPFGNRTVERMITISSGTFVAVDLADAAIRSAANPSSVSVPIFFANMVLRVNFVGIGRFAIAVAIDVGMGIKKSNKENERSKAMSEMLHLSNVKVYYRKADLMCSYGELYDKQADMHEAEANLWIEVQHTQESMNELRSVIEQTGKLYVDTVQEMDECFEEIESILPNVELMNPGLLEEMLRRLN